MIRLPDPAHARTLVAAVSGCDEGLDGAQRMQVKDSATLAGPHALFRPGRRLDGFGVWFL